MHEMSIARGIVDVAQRHARGRRVTSVQLRVGGLRQVVPESLDFYFGIVARGSACEGAALEQQLVPVRLRCSGCEREWEPEVPLFSCPACGTGAVEPVAGEELEIESIVIEEEEEPTACTASR